MEPSRIGKSVLLRGVIRAADSGDPVFNAKVRLPALRTAVFTDSQGAYRFVLPQAEAEQLVKIIVLKPGFSAGIAHATIPAGVEEHACPDLPLNPLPAFMLNGWFGYLISLFGPRLQSSLLGLTRLEMVLVGIVVLFFMPPVVLGLISRGLNVPGTEYDTVIRERLLEYRAPFASDAPIAFENIRVLYRPHVNYVIRSGTYTVDHQMVIEAGSTVTIEKGTTFKMGPHGSLFVKGVLQAAGESSHKIVFQAAETSQRWGNITFWEAHSDGSRLEHCVIQQGSGRRTAGSALGGFALNDAGAHSGGGVLIFNTTVTLDNVRVEDCRADNGGGLYIRNTPDQAGRPGSKFKSVEVLNCTAEVLGTSGAKLAAGGGAYVQRASPQFEECLFQKNRVVGTNSCGGGVYLGRDAQARFMRCDFLDNSATYSGGAMYVRDAGENKEYFLSGLNVEGGRIRQNHAAGTGGAISAENSRVRLSGVTFENNTVETIVLAAETKPVAMGGAVYLKYTEDFVRKQVPFVRATSAIEDCTFTGNRAVGGGGGAAEADNVAGGALAIPAEARVPLKLLGLRFTANEARTGREVAIAPSSYFGNWSGQWTPDVDTHGALRASGALHVMWPPNPVGLSIDASHPLPATCFNERPTHAVVSAVVVHYISAAVIQPQAPYDLAKILGLFTGESAPEEPRTSAHYLVDRRGRVYALVDERLRAWHAGKSRLPATAEDDVNNFSIGIELVMTEAAGPTPAQYIALARLVADIQRRYPNVTEQRIVGHDVVRAAWNQAHPDDPAAPKSDPGPQFDWALFRAHLHLAATD